MSEFYHIAKIKAFFGIPEKQATTNQNSKIVAVIQDQSPFSIKLAISVKGLSFHVEIQNLRFDQNGKSILNCLMATVGDTKKYHEEIERFRKLPIYTDHVILKFLDQKENFSHIDDALVFLSALFTGRKI